MKNNVNTTKMPLWMVFYVESATNSHFGTLKHKEFKTETRAQKFAKRVDSEVLPIIQGEVIS